MQIPKFSLWICALALCGGMALHADDTPAQAAARAALLQKLQAVQGTPAPATPPPAHATAATATPMATTPVDPVTGDTPAQAAARAALMQQLQSPVNPAPAAPAMTKTEAPPAPAATPAPVDPLTGDTQAQAQARAALAQKMADMGIPMNQPAAPAAPVVTKNAGTTAPQPVPMVAPPLPVTPAQEAKLQVLLSRYEANQISPEQYHEQRAAILAAP